MNTNNKEAKCNFESDSLSRSYELCRVRHPLAKLSYTWLESPSDSYACIVTNTVNFTVAAMKLCKVMDWLKKTLV